MNIVTAGAGRVQLEGRPHRHPGTARRQGRRVDGEGHRRAVRRCGGAITMSVPIVPAALTSETRRSVVASPAACIGLLPVRFASETGDISCQRRDFTGSPVW